MAKITFGTANSRKLNKHDVSIFSCGTLPVNGRVVSGCLPATRGDKFHINYSQESILAPLVAPTFGSFNVKTMAFFVPAHTIWRGYRSWITNSADVSTPNAPLNFSLEDLVYLITGDANPTSGNWTDEYVTNILTGSVANLTAFQNWLKANPHYDFIVYEIGSNQVNFAYGNFLSKGRELWSTLINLGYNFPTIIDCTVPVSPGVNHYYTDLNYSIYPLMAFARVCYDWLYPSAYVNQQGFSFLFETPLNTAWATATNRRNYIEKMIECWFNQYDQDFYTSLWARPNQVGVGSNQGNVSAIGSPVGLNRSTGAVGTDATSRVVSGDGAVLMNGSTAGGSGYNSGSPVNMSSLMLRTLTAVSDFALRNNIGGARFREFMKSHFGYNTENDTCDESIFLKLWSDTIHINKVANQSSGDMNSGIGALGELAGMGGSQGSGALKFEAKELGFLIFITEIKPNVGYYQGNRPWARALTDRFQLYTPEFDGVGMEGVPRQSVFSAYEDADSLTSVPATTLNDAFGFAPRYSERYKIGHDNLFGDFRFRSRNEGLNAWHTFRDVLYARNNLALDAQFLSVDNQYQRIFAYIGGESTGVGYDVEDKVWLKLNFAIDKYSTAKSLGNSLPFFDESGREAHENYLGSDIK